MNVYKVPVYWTMEGHIIVEGNTIEEAIQWTKDHLDDIDLPEGNSMYISDSFSVDENQDYVKCLNE
jgi:hypothetical protein